MTSRYDLTRRTLLGTAAASMALPGIVRAQNPTEVKVALLVPISGMYSRFGTVMRMGAEMALDHINAEGGVRSLGGAKLKLVVLDCGDTTEKAKNAAQRMVAQEPDIVAASGSYLSSFTLAVTEVTERAQLPVLTLSYSDLITARGFKYVFQTSATAASQAEQALPEILKLAETASGRKPQTVAIVTDNTGASVASVKPMREGLLQRLGLKLVVDETFTPPIADATPLIQKVRAARPDLFFFLPTVISDAKLVLEKMNEFGMGQGKVPTISFGIAIAMPDILNTVSADLLQGVLTCVGNWGVKGQEKLIAELKSRYNEPWMDQNAISTYGDMWIIKEALEKAGKADRVAVADALRNLDLGPSKYYPGGLTKFDAMGRRVGAGLTVVQWQNGVPYTVFPTELATAKPFWPKSS
ncbi:ABC transporter substrate-binding protein [Enterovirga aerilata]|uniref:ABC transporter substrate-binding protein n=1 Tax=Enterovirga aerilata TaxID=2730920 RepID=A0A849I6L0_9HYPH|nr:ABC transporter substrate-binding protein [Enterovirga sp. DB1703]NNM72941.1 ABC transporter substrate-binding protein [Enterovirga sp. DB1703]